MNQRERLTMLVEEYEPDGLDLFIREKDQISWRNIKTILKDKNENK